VKVLSLFSGVGGFDMGLEAAGFETIFQCEWDRYCLRILDKHWPHVPKWGDVSTLTGAHVLATAGTPDVVAWGSPCQDLSVAGKRAGLVGAKSGLFHEGIRIIKEIREQTHDKYPRISIWENVPGALSSNGGADFGVVLDEMAEAGALELEWAVLDAQFFGVAQRRRRIFLVALFDPADASRSRGKILPVAESLPRNTKTRGTKGKGTPGTTESGPDGSGIEDGAISFQPGTVIRATGGLWDEQSPTLRAEVKSGDNSPHVLQPVVTVIDRAAFNQGSNAKYDTIIREDDAMPALVARGPHAVGQPVEDIVFHPHRSDGVRLQEDGTANTLTAIMGTGGLNTPMVAQDRGKTIGFEPGAISRLKSRHHWDELSPTLRADMGDNQAAAAIPIVIPIQDGREMEKNQNGLGVGEASGPSYTLDQTGAQSVAYSVREDAIANTFSATQIDVANAVTALQPSPQSHHAQTFITQSLDDLFSFDTQFGSNATVFNEQSPTPKATQAPSSIAYQYDGYNQKLEEGDGVYRSLRVGRDPSDFVMQSMSMVIRRLTPLECERLMGWPDDHTKFDADGRILPDTQRYKMCGNGVASPVARWVGERLKVFI
jgi:DNA (cytosine-5)-methyltransferase 1